MRSKHATFNRGPGAAIVASAVTLLSGCFFDQLQKSQEADIQRVEHKQATLQSEQARSVTLNQQEGELATELEERELSLNELSERVQRINTENGRAIADNDTARGRYRDLLAQLHEINEQIAEAQHGGGAATAGRRERIDSLRARLREELDLLIN